MTLWPNKSQEPTAAGACSSAVAVHVASRRWLQLFSLGRFVGVMTNKEHEVITDQRRLIYG